MVGLEHCVHSALRYEPSGLESQESGRGWVATRDIEPGTTLLVERPVASYLDADLKDLQWENDYDLASG